MNRRQFLTRAIAALPVVAIAPAVIARIVEEIEPARTIFLPPAGGWVSYSEELAEIIRKAFVPRLVMQLYKSSPIMAALLKNAGGGQVVLPGQTVFAPGELVRDAERWEFEAPSLG